jgi:hypothetical protein
MVDERRKNFRVEWHSQGKISLDGRTICLCTISNLSNGGAKISGLNSAIVGDEFMLHVFEEELPRLCRVLWRRDNELGVQFADTLKKRRPKAAAKHPKARRRQPAEQH